MHSLPTWTSRTASVAPPANARCTSRASCGSSLRSQFILIRPQVNSGVSREHPTEDSDDILSSSVARVDATSLQFRAHDGRLWAEIEPTRRLDDHQNRLDQGRP